MLFIIAKVTAVLLSAVTMAMVMRMLLPFFTDVEDSRLYAFCFYISEPLVVPVRLFMVKMNIGQNSPIDWSFCLTYILLYFLQTLLPVL